MNECVSEEMTVMSKNTEQKNDSKKLHSISRATQ